MSALARRVVARHLKALDDTEVRELHGHLGKFDTLVQGLEEKTREILADPDARMSQVRAAVIITGTFDFLIRIGARPLFRGLLRGYQLNDDPKARKVVERANKTFYKSRMQRPKPEKAIEALKKFTVEMLLFRHVAKGLLKSGKFHSDEGSTTLVKAGPFTLVNTGGFSDKMMADVAKVVVKAAQLLSGHGFSKVCYGNVQVTNTVSSSTRVLAFYTPSRDELFIRANLRGKQGPALLSVIHELGHRLHLKFLKSNDREIKELYAAIGDRDRQLLWELRQDPDKHPKPGDTLRQGNSTYVVTQKELHRQGGQLHVSVTRQVKFGELPGPERTIKLDDWFKVTDQLAFVTAYAGTNYKENFAEMIAYYCTGRLPDDQVEMLKTVL